MAEGKTGVDLVIGIPDWIKEMSGLKDGVIVSASLHFNKDGYARLYVDAIPGKGDLETPKKHLTAYLVHGG